MQATKVKRPVLVVITALLVILAAVAGVAAALFAAARLVGDYTLSSSAEDALEEKTGVLYYNDSKYIFRSGQRVIALAATDGGKLVGAALISLTEDAEDAILVTVPAELTVPVKVRDDFGATVELEYGPLSRVYETGEDSEDAMELICAALSDLFHGIPICGYGLLPLDDAGELTDAVGDIELTLKGDVSGYGDDGETLTLTSGEPLELLRESNAQWQGILSGFFAALLDSAEHDPLPALRSALALVKSAETDLSGFQQTYLISQLFRERELKYEAVPTTEEDDAKQDDAALYELTIELFFDKTKK